MRVRLPCAGLAIIAILGCTAAVAQARPGHRHRGPSAAKIRKAVSRARHSRSLWATVNVCRHQGKGGSIGIRGQMPTLGFAAKLSMTIQLNQWSTKLKTFTALPYTTARTTVTPGTFATNLHQDGVVFPFSAPAGLLNATVSFSWSRNGKVLGTAVRQTTDRHHDAAGGHPAHYSEAQCRLG